MTPLPIHFDKDDHIYTALDTGEVLPHITGMLEETGWIDSRWYKEEHSERGTQVHRLTADYDLGALHLEESKGGYRAYLLAHVDLMARLKPDVLEVEVPIGHPYHRYAGRPDRVWRLNGQLAVVDIKSGGEEKSHAIQTALQAILVSLKYDNLPPEMFARYALYLTPKGKAKPRPHEDKRDFIKAEEIIRHCCR